MNSVEFYLAQKKRLETYKFLRWLVVFFGIYSVLLVFFAGGWLIYSGRSKEALLTFLVVVFARFIISPLVYIFYKKQRPYQQFKFETFHSSFFTEHTAWTGKSNSFPSDHAISFMAISTVFIYYLPLLGSALMVVTIFNGVCRVMLGYHDQIDVIGGWVLGSLTAILGIYFLGPVLFTVR